jgi:hypothetical protein
MSKGYYTRLAGLMIGILLLSCNKNETPAGPLNDGTGMRNQIVSQGTAANSQTEIRIYHFMGEVMTELAADSVRL